MKGETEKDEKLRMLEWVFLCISKDVFRSYHSLSLSLHCWILFDSEKRQEMRKNLFSIQATDERFYHFDILMRGWSGRSMAAKEFFM